MKVRVGPGIVADWAWILNFRLCSRNELKRDERKSNKGKRRVRRPAFWFENCGDWLEADAERQLELAWAIRDGRIGDGGCKRSIGRIQQVLAESAVSYV